MLFPYVYINGDILPLEDARIPVYDLGLLRGYALFDFFRVIDGIPVFAENHIDRLENSLKLMRLQTDLSREQ
jgi:branched-chain amino acid aminotransferase